MPYRTRNARRDGPGKPVARVTKACVDQVIPPPIGSPVPTDRFTKLTVFSLTDIEQDAEGAILPREVGVLGGSV